MAKNKLCMDCIYYNNGWCDARKTNKGLKDLTECELKKTDAVNDLEEYAKQKKFELDIDETEFNKGFVKGLDVALAILRKS